MAKEKKISHRIYNKWYKELWWWIQERIHLLFNRKPHWYGLRFRGKPIISDEEFESLPWYMHNIAERMNNVNKKWEGKTNDIECKILKNGEVHVYEDGKKVCRCGKRSYEDLSKM